MTMGIFWSKPNYQREEDLINKLKQTVQEMDKCFEERDYWVNKLSEAGETVKDYSSGLNKALKEGFARSEEITKKLAILGEQIEQREKEMEILVNPRRKGISGSCPAKEVFFLNKEEMQLSASDRKTTSSQKEQLNISKEEVKEAAPPVYSAEKTIDVYLNMNPGFFLKVILSIFSFFDKIIAFSKKHHIGIFSETSDPKIISKSFLHFFFANPSCKEELEDLFEEPELFSSDVDTSLSRMSTLIKDAQEENIQRGAYQKNLEDPGRLPTKKEDVLACLNLNQEATLQKTIAALCTKICPDQIKGIQSSIIEPYAQALGQKLGLANPASTEQTEIKPGEEAVLNDEIQADEEFHQRCFMSPTLRCSTNLNASSEESFFSREQKSEPKKSGGSCFLSNKSNLEDDSFSINLIPSVPQTAPNLGVGK